MIAGADGGDEALCVDAGEHRDGEFGADAGDGEKTLEEAFFLEIEEAEEGELVLGDARVDVQTGFGSFRGERRECGDGDGYVVAYAGTLDDGLVGSFAEEHAAKMGDHVAIV